MILNLVPEEKLSQIKYAEFIRIAVNIAIAVLFFLALASALLRYGSKKLEHQIKTILEPPQSELQQQVRRLNSQISRIDQIQKNTLGWSKILEDVNRLTFDGITLSNISLDNKNSLAVIQGTAVTRDKLISYQSRLETLKFLKDPNVPFNELLEKENVKFSITAKLTN